MPSYRSCRCSDLHTIDEYDDSEFTIDETDSSIKSVRLVQTQMQSCNCTDCKRSCASSFIAFLQRLLL